MTAISKSYVIPTDAATDADSPIDQALMQGLRDCIIFVKEWLGESFIAGAVQNHNHDGVNSALVEIGPNAIRNGSFEDGTNGWTISDYTGGSHTTDTSNDMDGATALAITSTSTANGGGVALSNEFRSCIGGLALAFLLAYKASVANVSSRARVIWYDDAQAQISTSDIYTSTNTPTTATTVNTVLTAPSTARFYKIELTGGIPGSGSATGTVYFDGVKAEKSMVGSVNGQIGAVVTTDLYAIGSSVNGRPANHTAYAVNSTLAGSSLYAMVSGGYRLSGVNKNPDGSSVFAAAPLVNVGSWRCVSQADGDNSTIGISGLWVRYA